MLNSHLTEHDLVSPLVKRIKESREEVLLILEEIRSDIPCTLALTKLASETRYARGIAWHEPRVTLITLAPKRGSYTRLRLDAPSNSALV
jgi:hypothetical protein